MIIETVAWSLIAFVTIGVLGTIATIISFIRGHYKQLPDYVETITITAEDNTKNKENENE